MAVIQGGLGWGDVAHEAVTWLLETLLEEVMDRPELWRKVLVALLAGRLCVGLHASRELLAVALVPERSVTWVACRQGPHVSRRAEPTAPQMNGRPRAR